MTTFETLLLGEGSLLVRCGDALAAKGQRIRAVVSPDITVRRWATKAGIQHCELNEAVELASQLAFDILFSIGNYAIIPDALLKLARRKCINYHYGPLPEYAGLHVPSWAIFERAAEYAITWHRIGDVVDGGSILKRIPVQIEPGDTALSLGLKCDDLALRSFDALVDDLTAGRETETPQDLTRRRYFSRHSQFPAEGFIDWSQDANQIAALVRATDYGPFASPLVWPKVCVDRQLFAVRAAKVAPAIPGAQPGQVVRVDSSGVQVAAASHSIVLGALSRLDGAPVAPGDLAQLSPGAKLSWPAGDIAEQLTRAGTSASRSESFWLDRLRTFHPTRLPYSPPVTADDEVGARPITEKCPVAAGIAELEVSASEYLTAAWIAFLARAAAVDDVHIAIAARRDEVTADYQDVLSPWLPLPFHVDATQPVAKIVKAIALELRSAEKRGGFRRDLIGRDLDLGKRAQRDELAPHVVISWGDRPSAKRRDLTDRPALELAIRAPDLGIEFHYDPRKLSRKYAGRLAAQFADWCRRLQGATAEPLCSVPVVSEHERAILVDEFNATRNDAMLGHCFHHLFERTARAHGGKIAVICADAELSYEQLNADADRLARKLRGKGVGRGDRVVVCLERSAELVVALLAVMKAGAAYVPLDPGFPAERLRQMVGDADPALILVSGRLPEAFDAWSERCFRPADLAPASAAAELDVASSPDDLVYVIYTSGSTGRPKGVEVTHGALCNLLLSMQDRPGCSEADRLLAVTTISFDIAALELFLPLLCGASVVMAQRHETIDGNALLALMQRHAITMLQATPATWQILHQCGWQGRPQLQKILCGGEALPRQLADRLLTCGESVWNVYGPTETTIWSSAWQVRAGSDVVIGAPVANTQLYVLDKDLSLVPLGFTGELCIGGAGVARGYHGDPAQTASRFVDNPFHPGKLYRTGDIVRLQEPGMLSWLGRADAQIKLRGFRIELGDVETAISSHPSVSRTVAVVRNDQLVAYCLRSTAQPGENSRRQADDSVVAEWRSAWNRAYEMDASDPTFNTAGWRNSYDGRPFSRDEMREWQANTVERIRSYRPEHAFEVGSGTGLILFGVAPHCRSYRAIDGSAQAVELTRSQLGSLPHVTCDLRMATDLPEVAPGAFDTIIINSVTQYFPNVDYLMSVVEWATRVVTRGRVFIGDVRNLSLLGVFHADITEYRNPDGISDDELRQRAERSRQSERELVIAPELFANLPSLLPQICRVDIALKSGGHVNELTRYRYDVTLHIGEASATSADARALDWRGERLDLPSLRDRLAAKAVPQLRLANVPNGRLSEVHRRVSRVVGTGASPAPASWIDPVDLGRVASEAGYQLALVPARSGEPWAFDAVLWRSDAAAQPDLTWLPAVPIDRKAMAQFANVPGAAAVAKTPLDPILRPWLERRVPSYMMPAFFVELDELPLTPNGKVDKNALPEPVELAIESAVRPASELEHQILSIWREVLGHDTISVDANFFKIGGDSLRVVRVQSQLEQLLGRQVPTVTLYDYYTIKDLAAQLVGSRRPAPVAVPVRRQNTAETDIAIVAMACRLPGGVHNPEEFWELLARGADATVEVPKTRWDAQAIYDPDPEVKGMSYCRRGGFLDDVDMFDAAFFGISPREARALHPEQRFLLEVSWEALERAGYRAEQLRASQTGVFVGVGTGYHEYGLTLVNRLDELDGYVGTGSAGCTLSGRLSYVLGLEGPSVTIDTACSASLVAMHLGCNALRQGECDLALAAGVTMVLKPDLFVEFSRLRGMAPDGRCKSFSSAADGTGWSEGCAVLVLKRLPDAERDGDPVLALVRGTAVNHDGHSASLTTPSGLAQQRVIRQALAMAGLQPDDIDYVEAHGTGTKLGDPIEASSLGAVFGPTRSDDKPLWIGSVKSNLGHTQAAAGAAGVMKTILAMHHDKVPRSLHVVDVSPYVDWASGRLEVLKDEKPWQRNGRPRRAGISSFGIGGTNAHVVIEEPPTRLAGAPWTVSPQPSTLPFVVSGHTEAALRAQAGQLQQHLEVHGQQRLEDVAFSLATTRTHLRKRLVVFAKERAELVGALASFARTGETPFGAVRTDGMTEAPGVAMLFSGQGSQLPGMGKNLYELHPVFRAALDAIAAQFSALERPLLDVMWSEPGTEAAALLHRTDFTQPALFALEVALWRLWDSWGVKPALLLGHSIGELAAAHVAGVFDLADACRLVGARGRLMQALPRGGAMASLEASGDEVQAVLDPLGLSAKVDIAGLNTPVQTVVSGDADGVEQLVAHFAREQRKAKRLEVSHAFHSHRMEGMLAEFRGVAQTIRYAEPSIPLISTLSGVRARPDELSQPEYWVRQVRQTVRFNAGMMAMREEAVHVFLELGPQPVLSGMGAACLEGSGPSTWLPSLRSGREDALVMQRSLGELHALGIDPDWRTYFAPFGGARVTLPTYAFQRERYWLEPAAGREISAGLMDTGHALLGAGVQVAGKELTVFTATVSSVAPSWVLDHRVLDAVVMPGTAFLEAMRAAGNAGDKGAWDVADVVMVAPLVLPSEAPVKLQVTVGRGSADGRPVQVYSLAEATADDGPWQLHAEGKLVPAAPATHGPSVTLPPDDGEQTDVASLYEMLAGLGYGYGPAFQGLKEAWRVREAVWARAALPEAMAPTASHYGLHPALLDSAMHSVLLTQELARRLADQASDDVFVPFEFGRVTLWQTGLAEIWVNIVEFDWVEGEIRAALDIYDTRGALVGKLEGLRARRVDRATLRRLALAGVDRFQFDVAWRPAEPAQRIDRATPSWGLLRAAQVTWADDVRSGLAAAGIQAVEISALHEAAQLDGMICLWSAPGDVIADAHALSAEALTQAQALASSEFGNPVVWVTRGAVGTGDEDRVPELGSGPVWGIARTARTEHPGLALRLVDLGEEPADLDALGLALALEDEPECALRHGQVLVPRLERATGSDSVALPSDGMWRLEIGKKGRLDQPLVARALDNTAVTAGQVRASVKAAGVNFRDVLNALGMVDNPFIGFEFAGVVTELGEAVTDLAIGDPVFGIGRGSFAPFVVADAREIVRMPAGLSFEQAAALPMAFLTAWYGLYDLGRMQPGEKVLIHAAAGGVGMAAVQLAQLRGAEVYGTASEPKWAALRELGLDETHVGTSRSLEFADRFRTTAPGRSFDIVLNALAREFIDSSLALLGKGGRFLEMGRTDLREPSWVSDHHPGVSYRAFDLGEAGAERLHEILLEVAELFGQGKLRPLPIRTFPLDRGADALRFMAAARHVGKIVLVPAQERPLVQPGGAVLVTGGLGGLGMQVARWLGMEQGVKDLVLTSRRGLDSPEAEQFVAELAELGISATVVACDVADREGLERIMTTFTGERPLRGVVHAAGVLDDGILTALTPARLDPVLSPKVDGAWHLHQLTQDLELDLFVMFSSISGLIGAAGQGNYAAANTFLDALAHHRRARGLPACAVAWGAWSGHGMAAKLSDADRMRFSRQGMDSLTPEEGMALFETAAKDGGALVVAAALDLPRLRRSLEGHGPVPALLRSLFGRSSAPAQTSAASGNLRAVLAATPPEDHESVVLRAVQVEVAKVFEFASPDDVDVNLSLPDMGLDSLTAVLLRNQLADLTGLTLPARVTFDHPHLRALSQFLVAQLKETAQGSGAARPRPAAPRRADPKLELAHLDPTVQFAGTSGEPLGAPSAVFMTGATGFVGAFLLHELLKSEVAVHCLVRARNPGHATERVQKALDSYGLWSGDHARLIHPVVGELDQPLFGLAEDDFNQLADQVDTICHAGALVNWMLPLESYRGPNINGTHEVLRLAARGRRKAVHSMSTYATLPRHQGYPLAPDARESGYVQTKWMGEQMIAAARWRGAAASVYRLPLVGADSSTGRYRLDRGDFVHNLMTGCIELGCFPALSCQLRVLMPIDYLARVIGHAMLRDPSRLGRSYDFIHSQAPTFEQFVELVRAVGCQVELAPFDEWMTKAQSYAQTHKTSALARIDMVLDGVPREDLEILFQGFPVGEVLDDASHPLPAMDQRSIHAYVKRMAAGSITPPLPAPDPARAAAQHPA